MTDTTSFVFKRRAFAKNAGNGVSIAEWTLTPRSLTDPVQIVVEPISTLPIIFVPGIMGSNLMTTVAVGRRTPGDAVWLMNSKPGAGWDWARVDAAARQQLLNPMTTAVFDRGQVPSDIPSIGDADAIRTQRHWGEVSAASYGDLLVWLQSAMNHSGRTAKWRAETYETDFARYLDHGMTFKPLAEPDVQHAANFRFPVYACGYNWLQSNRKAADTLANRIKAVIEANNSKSYSCEKVILVTHSMGGLVARACSELAGMRNCIAGIVHGVMPATGAAVAYKRVRSGTEGSAGLVLGDTAAKVTAVFANSPGALQLLPNKQYGSGWLQLGMTYRGIPRQIESLPKADPYEEIYRQRGAWWALVQEALINPANAKRHKGWAQYLENISAAADFHDQLGARYHPNTFTFHGSDTCPSDGMTWGTVGWFAQAGGVNFDPTAAELLALRSLSDDGVGVCSAADVVGRRYPFSMTAKNAAGDGTVPVRSGSAPAGAGVQATYHLYLGAHGHEGAYRSETARRITLHSIVRIAQTARVLE